MIKIVWILFALLLAGCNEKQDYSYYMQHPQVLKQNITECQSRLETTKEEAAKCEVVMHAAYNMMSLLKEQQEDPEKFGERIMNAEANYMNLKDANIKAQELQEIGVLLAVVGMSSPD